MNLNNEGSLNRKLQIMVAIFSMIILYVVIATMYIATRTTVLNDIDNDLKTTAEMLSYNLTASLVFNDEETSKTILDGLSKSHSMIKAVVYKDGGVFVQYDSTDKKSTLLPSKQSLGKIDNIGENRYINVPINFNGNSIGRLLLISDLSSWNEVSKKFYYTAFIVFFVILICTYLLSLWLNKYISTPLQELCQWADYVSDSGHFKFTVQQDRKDEIGKLAMLLNEMVEKLSAKEKLEYLNKQLKVEVEERKKTEEKYRIMKEEAEYANNAKSAFLAAMSHEIRTPMNGVVGMLDLLMQKPMDPEANKMVMIMKDSAFSLLRVINDILDFSKIEANKLVLEPIPTNLINLLERIADTVITNINKKDIDFWMYTDPKIPSLLRLDQVRVRQILVNLIGNATKFTSSSKKKRGIIKFSAVVEKNTKDYVYMLFEVSDNGIGIQENKIETLFTEFEQGNISTKYGGTGLGLPISKRLTELMKGTISVESQEKTGSIFKVKLKLEKVNKHQTVKRVDSTEPVSVLVLSLDDNEFTIIERYLSSMGLIVSRCPSVDEVILKLQSSKFEILILGVSLELDHKINLSKKVMNITALCNTRILVLTRTYDYNKPTVSNVVYLRSSPLKLTDFYNGVLVTLGLISPDVSIAKRKEIVDVVLPSIEESEKDGKLILVAEDNETNQEVIMMQLNSLGYNAIVAKDGEEALRILGEHKFDLIITDCHMPKMDGFQFTKAIRNMEKETGNRIPIIAATANALHGEVEKCLSAGMDGYLHKPIERYKLKEAISRWLPSTNEHRAKDKCVIDLKQFSAIVGDDPNIQKNILQKFVQTSPKHIEDIDSALLDKDKDIIISEAHKLKSSSSAIGAMKLSKISADIERIAKLSDDWGEINKHVEHLREEFILVKNYINNLS